MGIGFLWAIILGFGIQFFPESPKHDYRKGNEGTARMTMAKLLGTGEDHPKIDAQMKEMQDKLDAERTGGDHPWYEVRCSDHSQLKGRN
jgi:SP family sugar:H+ symporter-like MFS transporter